jgi:hypothetical protein
MASARDEEDLEEKDRYRQRLKTLLAWKIFKPLESVTYKCIFLLYTPR